MALLPKSDSKRLHSWLWDSHISPKNSKWLHENLNDMDLKVKAMFKLINEDADSFARKAEMYYKRRPELTKLVEEFYRAYRALAERYVHATRALKQAHRTMAEAFPNQIPALSDDSPAGSVNGEEPRTSEELPSSDPPFDSITFQKDDTKKNDTSNIEFLNVRKGLKPITDMFSQGHGSLKSFGAGTRKELDFDEEFEDAFEKAKKLQEKISKLTSENENLLEQVKSETQNASKVQSEVEILKSAQAKLILEKEDALKKFQECLKKVSNLEAELKKFKMINDELQVKANRLDSVDEIYNLLKEENKSLQLKVSELEQKSSEQQEELSYKEGELEKLKIRVQDECLRSEQAEAALGSLEELHSNAQEKLKASSLEIENGVQMLKDLELKKQTLEEDIKQVQEENNKLNREVMLKQEELEKLNATLQNELARSIQAEAALQSLQILHSQSQEELQQLMSDIQSKVHTLNDVETRKQGLEEELAKLKEEIIILNEQNISSKAMIQLLQDEILSLKQDNHKLEAEVRLHVEGKENLQKELGGLKDEMCILQQKHQEIMDQMQAVGLSEQSFQTSVKELQEGNLELKETCTKQEGENMILLEKLEEMEKVSEKNAKLEVSLLDANVELDELREKVNTLQISYESLNREHLVLVSEKNSLVVKVGGITETMGKLLENNNFLENSVSDANYELEELRGKLKILEEASQVLQDENSNVQEKDSILLSQVDLIGRSLESLEKKYAEMQEMHSNLEREKESTQEMLTKLSEVSKMEKQEHEDFRHSTNARLAVLENQINLLHEDSAKREEKYKEEQFKLLASQIETFILEQCLCDLRHGNLNLAREHHKLEKHIIGQEGQLLLMLELTGRLRKGMHKVLNALLSNEDYEFSDAMEESCWQFILNKVKEIQNRIFDTEDEKLRLEIENSVNATLVQQLGFELAELKSDKVSLEIDCQKRTDELVLLQAEKSTLLGLNEQLKQEMQVGNAREEALEKEIETLERQLSELKVVYSASQNENTMLVKESQSLSSQLNNLKAEKSMVEEEIRSLLQEYVSVDCLSLIFEHYSSERASELKALVHELKCSHETNKDLQKKMQEMNEKMQSIEEENLKLKEYVLKSEESHSHLDLSGRDRQAYQYLESTSAEVKEAKPVRDGLQVLPLSSEMIGNNSDIAHETEVHEALRREVFKLSKENECLKAKEQQWSANFLSEVERCENEVAVLCNDIHEATVHVAVFEDKIQELMGVCEKMEIKSMVERTTLDQEVSLRNLHIQKLSRQLSGKEGSTSDSKSELDVYLPLISSLHHEISTLESYLIPSDNNYSRDGIQAESETVMSDHTKSNEERSKEIEMVPEGVLELRRILTKVEAIHRVLLESGSQQALPSHSGVKTDEKGHEVALAVETSESHDNCVAAPLSVEVVEPENDILTRSRRKMSSDKDELAMKDIQLDQASSSSKFDADDSPFMMNVNGHHMNDNFNPPSISVGSDTDNFQTEATEEEKSEHPVSGLAIERELSIDKIEVPRKDSRQDWKQEVIEKLKSDAHRLVSLEETMESLKKKMEKSEKSSLPKSSDYESVKLKLEEANGDILLLTNVNRKLIKRTEDLPSFYEGEHVESEDLANLQNRITGRARRGSEKIGRLELELQKIQYVLLKLEEEQQYHSNKSSTRRKVLLRDYLYGKRADGSRRKSCLSWCARPQTKDT